MKLPRKNHYVSKSFHMMQKEYVKILSLYVKALAFVELCCDAAPTHVVRCLVLYEASKAM